MQPSRKQRTELSRTLKQFAFDQSPLFQDGMIQAMEATQTFEIINRIPDECALPGTLMFDQTRIKLGFCATRFSDESRSHPVYTYEVSTEGTQLMHPRQLNLSNDAWVALWKKYLEDDESLSTDDDTDVNTLQDETVSEGTKEDIIDCLMDAGAECELYQKSMLSFSSCEEGIESSYERGTSIANALYDSVSTHDHYDNDWKVYTTPDGELYVPDSFAPDELPLGDEIEVRLQFTDIIRAFGTDQQAAENGLLPHEDKLREMLYVIDCMRKRRIDL